jgi:hypothetical protein
LQCAFPEESGDTVAVFNLDSCHPYKWSLKHRLSARDVFGKDDLVRSYGSFLRWITYRVVALDLDREVLFLFDKDSNKLLSYNISTGNHSVIQDDCLLRDCAYYVA